MARSRVHRARAWPGYYGGQPNGLWNIAPTQLDALVAAYHEAGLQLHIHTNGDEATSVALDALERALARNPRPDHRHTLQHCQMADAAQFRRMRALGVCVNLFANHIYYWGDVHQAITIGPDRAQRMNAAGTAQRLGVPFAIHSDAPITPMGPLFTAWCAVNRRTASGRVLGEGERIRSTTRCARSRWARRIRCAWTARSAASRWASAPTSRCWPTTRWRCRRRR